MLKHFQTHSLFQEYQRLANLPVLSAVDEKRILKILKIAETDDLLDTLITEFEDSLAQKEGFLEEKYLEYYKDQSDKLKFFIKNLSESS
ncbi:hypothetical protein AB0756_39755 [Tolypothrix campylonemoides VB511288_2]|uniref:Uncharacterized protein n=1 Tax=Tolypothrix campylonemoides VB511288_2 TaxID=3232311 RepID=A0ABW8XMI5_9CYAN